MFSSISDMLHVYTGNGKGKTTCALGLALRAIGHGLRVVMIQFMKGGIKYGELESAKLLTPLFTIIPMGRADFVSKENPALVDIEWAEKGLNTAEEIIKNEACDILILDELLVAVDFRLVSVERVIELIKKTPSTIELVLTGRGAPPEISGIADLVSEMVEIKHYFTKGIVSRKGFDY